jgi:hypothetical protein
VRRDAFDFLWRVAGDAWDGGVTQQEHSLQVATRADAAGASEETVFVALVHDLGKPLRAEGHGDVIARCFPRLSPVAELVLRLHETGVARVRAGEEVDGFPELAEFAAWDAASFERGFPSRPLRDFEPLVDEFLEG